MNNLVEEMGYETPEVKMIVVEVEQGFYISEGGAGSSRPGVV